MTSTSPRATADRRALDFALKPTPGLIVVTGGSREQRAASVAAIIHEVAHVRSLYIHDIVEKSAGAYESGADGALVSVREVGDGQRNVTEEILIGRRNRAHIITVPEVSDPRTWREAFAAATNGHLVIISVDAVDTESARELLADLSWHNPLIASLVERETLLVFSVLE